MLINILRKRENITPIKNNES